MSAQAQTTPCLIVGAGPAGLSAALWLHELRVPFTWWSADGQLGGTLARVNNPIQTLPGQPLARGKDAVSAWRDHVQALGLPGPAPQAVTELAWSAQGWSAHGLLAQQVILATGTRYRRLGLPGELEGLGRYTSQSASGDAARVAGQTVAMVGGGDAAVEGALILAQRGCQVHLLTRSPTLRARADFIERLKAHPGIRRWPAPTRVLAIHERPQGCALDLEVQGKQAALEVACLFVRVGVEPVVPAIQGPPTADALAQDAQGYLIVDRQQRASWPGLWAAGDVISDPLQAVSWALGQGARAARGVAQALGRFDP